MYMLRCTCTYETSTICTFTCTCYNVHVHMYSLLHIYKTSTDGSTSEMYLKSEDIPIYDIHYY